MIKQRGLAVNCTSHYDSRLPSHFAIFVRVTSCSPVLHLVWQCYAYSQYKVQNHAGHKMGELGPHQLQLNKVSDSINYHFIKHHAWVRTSTFHKRWNKQLSYGRETVRARSTISRGVNLRLNFRLKGYFWRHCDMTQTTLTYSIMSMFTFRVVRYWHTKWHFMASKDPIVLQTYSKCANSIPPT